MFVKAKVVHSADVVEINTYEQLRELDEHSSQLKNEAIETICQVFGRINEKRREQEKPCLECSTVSGR